MNTEEKNFFDVPSFKCFERLRKIAEGIKLERIVHFPHKILKLLTAPGSTNPTMSWAWVTSGERESGNSHTSARSLHDLSILGQIKTIEKLFVASFIVLSTPATRLTTPYAHTKTPDVNNFFLVIFPHRKHPQIVSSPVHVAADDAFFIIE